MYKINTSTAVNKRFVDGNVSTQTPPTDLNAQWFNHIQGELVNAIEGLGGTVDGVNENSLATAINNFKTAIEARAKSLEDSRTNRMGEIITTINTTRPPDCLPCDGSDYAKSDFQDFVNYAVTKGYFADNGGEAKDMYTTGRYGKLIHGGYSATNPRFVVPNLTGMFLRMTGGIEAGRLGYYQADDLKSHSHFIANSNRANLITGSNGNQVVQNPSGASGGHLSTEGNFSGGNSIFNYSFLFSNTYPNALRSSNTGGTETRPMNIAVMFWIRYK